MDKITVPYYKSIATFTLNPFFCLTLTISDDKSTNATSPA